MADRPSLTREDLDRLKLKVGDSPMMLGCADHPEAGNTALYEEGHIRLLCRTCGFEAARIKVALKAPDEITAEEAQSILVFMPTKASEGSIGHRVLTKLRCIQARG